MRTEIADIDRELGELLRLHRVAAGLSCDEIARLSDYSEQDINRLECGEVSLTIRDLINLSITLNLSLTELMTQLQTRLCLNDRICIDGASRAITLLASNRGRQAVHALAGCNNPDLVEALFDLIVASCVSAAHEPCHIGKAN